jgi:hypothetical protein
MEYLIDFSETDEEFRRINERASGYPIVQGVVLDLDRDWLRAWQIQEKFGNAFLLRWADFLEDWFFHGPMHRSRSPWLGILDFPESPAIYSRPVEWKDIQRWRPPNWRWHQRLFGLPEDALPLVVKVCLRPRITPEEAVPTIEELKGGNERLRVELAPRAQAELSASPRQQHRPVLGGISIGKSANDFGTLGVILKNSDDRYYALTCSHVAARNDSVDQPAQRDRKKTTPIGKSVVSTTLLPCTSTTPCNPWSGVASNLLDLSLIELDSVGARMEVLSIGGLSGIAPRSSLTTGQAVEVVGRTSGYNMLQIGGLAVWYRFMDANGYYCFRNMFEVESLYGCTRVIQKGDSGAPVCTPDSKGTAWCGMIVGCDAFKGFAIYSEPAMTWLGQQGYNLQPV